MEVLAISTDSIYAHKVFTEVSPSAATVRYPLLSDRSGRITSAYGALDPETGTARRVTVLVSPEGVVSFYLAYPPDVGRSAAEILRLVMAVQVARETGAGVPANWVPGAPLVRRDIKFAGMV